MAGPIEVRVRYDSQAYFPISKLKEQERVQGDLEKLAQEPPMGKDVKIRLIDVIFHDEGHVERYEMTDCSYEEIPRRTDSIRRIVDQRTFTPEELDKK